MADSHTKDGACRRPLLEEGASAAVDLADIVVKFQEVVGALPSSRQYQNICFSLL